MFFLIYNSIVLTNSECLQAQRRDEEGWNSSSCQTPFSMWWGGVKPSSSHWTSMWPPATHTSLPCSKHKTEGECISHHHFPARNEQHSRPPPPLPCSELVMFQLWLSVMIGSVYTCYCTFIFFFLFLFLSIWLQTHARYMWTIIHIDSYVCTDCLYVHRPLVYSINTQCCILRGY